MAETRPRAPRHPSHYAAVAVDMIGYSKRTGQEHAEARADLADLLDRAAAGAALDRDTWIIQDSGDGELALIPGAVPLASLVAGFMRELYAELAEYNRKRTAEARIRLRAALHHGQARVQGTGFPGQAAIVAARLVDSRPVRAALEGRPEAHLAVILSDQMYADTVAERERGLRPDDYTRVEIGEGEIKKGDPARVAWVTVPGSGAPELPKAADKATAGAAAPGGVSQVVTGEGARALQANDHSQVSYDGPAIGSVNAGRVETGR